jgi:hypothetical protein
LDWRAPTAFLYSESINLTSYSRQRDKVREELTFAQIDHHAEAVDELDVERAQNGINLGFRSAPLASVERRPRRISRKNEGKW